MIIIITRIFIWLRECDFFSFFFGLNRMILNLFFLFFFKSQHLLLLFHLFFLFLGWFNRAKQQQQGKWKTLTVFSLDSITFATRITHSSDEKNLRISKKVLIKNLIPVFCRQKRFLRFFFVVEIETNCWKRKKDKKNFHLIYKVNNNQSINQKYRRRRKS